MKTNKTELATATKHIVNTKVPSQVLISRDELVKILQSCELTMVQQIKLNKQLGYMFTV